MKNGASMELSPELKARIDKQHNDDLYESPGGFGELRSATEWKSIHSAWIQELNVEINRLEKLLKKSERPILEELNALGAAFRKAGGNLKGVVLGKEECRLIASLEPNNFFASLQAMGMTIQFSNEEKCLDVF